MPSQSSDNQFAYMAGGKNLAAAIYGLILAMSVLAVYGTEDQPSLWETMISVITTAVVFWFAHVYSRLLAVRIERRHKASLQEIRRVAAFEWPIVQAAGLPLVPIVLGLLDVWSHETSIDLALYLTLAELALLGVYSARRAGATGLVMFGSGAVAFGFGVVIVALKVFLH